MAFDEFKYERAEFEIVYDAWIEREVNGHIAIALGIKP